MAQSNNNADVVPETDRFKYIDDLSILELVCLFGLLKEYQFKTHIPSDIATEQLYLPPESFNTQRKIDQISDWTQTNLMKLNAAKSKYMIFTRSKQPFTTRLTMDGDNLERISVTKLLGVWISEDMSWSRNCREICRKAFSRLSMITKLKYVGICEEDLVDIYVLFIRSVAEYCSVSFHSSLTQEQTRKLEGIQKTCVRVILGEKYENYQSALETLGLESLEERRKQRCLNFALKCLKHPRNQRLFQANENNNNYNMRTNEKFKVNFAKTSMYQNSTIPYCQRLLNSYFLAKSK